MLPARDSPIRHRGAPVLVHSRHRRRQDSQAYGGNGHDECVLTGWSGMQQEFKADGQLCARRSRACRAIISSSLVGIARAGGLARNNKSRATSCGYIAGVCRFVSRWPNVSPGCVASGAAVPHHPGGDGRADGRRALHLRPRHAPGFPTQRSARATPAIQRNVDAIRRTQAYIDQGYVRPSSWTR
jgi:hypothetical protein